MAVCWLSARTCSLPPSSFCFSSCVSFSPLATRHSPLLFTVDGRPSGQRPASRRPRQPPHHLHHLLRLAIQIIESEPINAVRAVEQRDALSHENALRRTRQEKRGIEL